MPLLIQPTHSRATRTKYTTAEFLLRRHANSGSIIAVRSVLSGGLVFGAASALDVLVDPAHRFTFHFAWLGGSIAFFYAALYSRFASQWLYLANLYNQIKVAQIKYLSDHVKAGAAPDASRQEALDRLAPLDELMAAFVSDAVELHLARKSTFRATCIEWCRRPGVRSVLLAADDPYLLRTLEDIGALPERALRASRCAP